MGGDESGAEEEAAEGEPAAEEGTLLSQVDNCVDLLEKNRDIKLLPEQFIYPFDLDHKPMLGKNLVASVSVNASGGFVSSKINEKDKKKLGEKKLGSTGDSGANPLDSIGSSVAKKKDDKNAGKPKKAVALPEFEISGKFGTDKDQYIVIGNRYYGIDERLKGSRELKNVRLVGVDDHLAYFKYEDTTFVKKIKALDKIFQ